MIAFVIDGRSRVRRYLQITQQVTRAILLGRLRVGDQLPTVREVVSKIEIAPNTVFRAYRDLQMLGAVELRPGHGTFVRRAPRPLGPSELAALKRRLLRWMRSATEAGMGPDAMSALFREALQESYRRRAPSEDTS